jgi:hypothetical protein
MPDFGAPVAQNIDTSPAKGFATLSGMMGLQRQQQELQSGALGIQRQQATLPAVQAEAGLAQAKIAQTQAFAEAYSALSPEDQQNPARVIALQGQVAPLAPELGESVMKAHSAKVGLQAASMGLDVGQKAVLVGPLQGLTTDPGNPALVKSASDIFDQWGQAHPEMAPNVGYAKELLQHVQTAQQQALQLTDPAAKAEALKKVSHLANAMSTTFQGGQQVQTQPQAATVSTGRTTMQGTVAPPVAGGAFTPTSQTSLEQPPGTITLQDPRTGNAYAFDPAHPEKTVLIGQGEALPKKPANGAWPPAAVTEEQRKVIQRELDAEKDPAARASLQRELDRLGGSAPPVMSVGEAGQVTANTGTVTATRQQAADAQTQHDILNRIQSLAATPGLYLGPGSKNLADLATAVAGLPGMEGAAKYANNYNELVKFMAQNVARQGQALGLSGSDARLNAAIHANPNADPMDSRTVQNVAQYMGGIVRMALAKADAMDNWLKQPGNSLQNEHNFEKLWRDNADPRLFQLAEMKDQGAALDYAKVHVRPSEQAALKKKHDVLQKLGAL